VDGSKTKLASHVYGKLNQTGFQFIAAFSGSFCYTEKFLDFCLRSVSWH
jgi:hypothetical protein